MKHQIELQRTVVEYTLRPSTRSKRIWLTVKCDGSFVVSAPSRMKPEKINEFIHKKANWVLEKLEYFRKNPGLVVRLSAHDLRLHKATALRLAKTRLSHFNELYGFRFGKVSIRKQRSRWGSCSKTGNLSFNYQIALLPPHLSDYIIVHELCHLGEFNHSKKFWKLVERAIPNHAAIRREFRRINIHK